MKRKKKILAAAIVVLVLLVIGTGIFVWMSRENTGVRRTSLEEVKKQFAGDIEELGKGKYDNLKYHDFTASIEEAEGLHQIEILTNKEYLDRTFLESFAIMNEVIDRFFREDFDKSYLVVDFHLSNGEEIDVNYYDVETVCADEKFNEPRVEFLFGNKVKDGGYMVQITENLNNVWLSKGELDDIHPSQGEYKRVYYYLSGLRQVEDAELTLKDGKILLSEFEKNVLWYLNHSFPLPLSEHITLGIGDIRILHRGAWEGVCLKIRRFYKGVPFEYGSNTVSGGYIDPVGNDHGELSYAVSAYPDTMLSFGRTDGTVVETGEITELISLSTALQLLSERIGEYSVYEVYGVELVYRESSIPKERSDELNSILAPKWKVITINQNDEHYTLFYIDVVTGEITDRFEYYYE